MSSLADRVNTLFEEQQNTVVEHQILTNGQMKKVNQTVSLNAESKQ